MCDFIYTYVHEVSNVFVFVFKYVFKISPITPKYAQKQRDGVRTLCMKL